MCTIEQVEATQQFRWVVKSEATGITYAAFLKPDRAQADAFARDRMRASAVVEPVTFRCGEHGRFWFADAQPFEDTGRVSCGGCDIPATDDEAQRYWDAHEPDDRELSRFYGGDGPRPTTPEEFRAMQGLK